MLPLLLVLLVAATALGKTLDGRLPFIIHGKDVDYAGKYPYQASQHYYGSHNCGAAIVSDRFLISAAHCCSTTPDYYTIYVGAHDIKTKREGKPVKHSVEYMKLNPGYGKGKGLNQADICVIKVTSAIAFNDYVATIDLPDYNAGEFVGANCVITGWGNTKIGSTGAPNILQEANTKPLSVSICKTKIATHPYFDENDVVASHICIGSYGNEGSCHGDSGGPLACSYQGKRVLAGVTSWGSPDCNPIYPTMYTRITSFRYWIKNETGL